MDRKSAAVVMSWRTTGEIIKDSASAARTRAWEARRARPAAPGRKRFAIEVDQEEREGSAGDPYPAVPGQFQERGEDDQEADAPRDEREPLASPQGIFRGAANQEHHADQDRGPFEDGDDREDAEGRPPAVEEEGTHQEPEAREGVCPWRGRCLPARQAGPEDPRVPLRRPDQEHDGRGGSEEMPDGRTIGREQDVDEDSRPREQGDGCDIASSGGEGPTADARPDPFHEEDRDRDADDRVVDRQPDGPDPVHVEPPAVPAEGPEVHPGRVEERLHREAFLDDAVRRAEEQDARPPGLPADRGLAHDEDAGAVQPDQEEGGDRVQPFQGWSGPGEHLRDHRREEDEREERTSVWMRAWVLHEGTRGPAGSSTARKQCCRARRSAEPVFPFGRARSPSKEKLRPVGSF